MSQNSLVLPTSGTLSGLAAVEAINAALDTLNTLASGASAPSTPEAGQIWHDTANKLLKIRSMDNTTWISLGSLNETSYTFAATAAAALTGTLGIANGGTGATTAAAALTALLSGSTIPQANGGTGHTTVAALFTTSLSTNGYEVSPSGRITQWGVASGYVSGGVGVVTFPITFPNACLNVVTTINGGAGVTNSATAYSLASNGFYLANNSNVTANVYWHAEGY